MCNVQNVVFFYVKPYCAALERRGNFGSKSDLGAFSAKMPLFQKQSAGLFLKFTPKRGGQTPAGINAVIHI